MNDDKYEIPQLNIKSSYADKINKSILKKFEGIIDGIQETQYIDFECEGLKYKYFENDDILSLVMYMPTESGGVFGCDVYNINTVTGEEVYGEEIIEKLNITKEELSEKIGSTMRKHVEERAERNNSELDSRYSAMVDAAVIIAMETDINKQKLFINDDNHLCMYLNTINLGFAGGETGSYIFDLDSEKSDLVVELF